MAHPLSTSTTHTLPSVEALGVFPQAESSVQSHIAFASGLAPLNKILIASSNTGGGHRSAALSLKESFVHHAKQQWHMSVSMTQVLEEASWLTHQMAHVYNWLLRHKQSWMKYYYALIHSLKPHENPWILDMAFPYGKRIVERTLPKMIVSVHPMTQHFFAYVLKRMGLLHRIPIVTVVTDPIAQFWRGWACPEVSLYCVATQSAKQELIAYGVHPEKIQVAGMPIHSKFQPVSRHHRLALEQKYQLRSEGFNVCFNAGWVGGGNIPALFQATLQANHRFTDSPLQLLFLAGNNPKLLQMGYELAQAYPEIPLSVLDASQADMLDVMQLSDVLVSKLGGLTTFEALACHTPFIADALTPPMPQELATYEWLHHQGLGVVTYDLETCVDTLTGWLYNPEQYLKVKTRCEAQAFHQHNASAIVAHILTSMAPSISVSSDDALTRLITSEETAPSSLVGMH
ncbi:MAG: MGDG synthase family glycosyltransferase [Vampirovibrionales bacterium]